MDFISNLANEESGGENGIVIELDSLYAHFEQIEDRRKPKGVRYQLVTILVLILLAKMGGEDNPTAIAEWVAHRKEGLVKLLSLPRQSVPHHTTYRRILQEVIQPEEFEAIVGEYQRKQVKEEVEIIITIDGKTVRGTIAGGELRGTHLLAAYLPESGLVLMEVAVDKKENEITAAPRVLQHLDLSGAIVIADAMHAQRQISVQIVESGGDFIWTIKGNQARTQWAIQRLFSHEVANLKKGAPLGKDFQMACLPTAKRHGRIEKRSILVSQVLNDYLDWPHVAQVFRIEREVWRDHGKHKSRQVVFGLTSLAPQQASPMRLLELVRSYWGIENGLHYRRDVTLREDATRAVVGHTGHNLAIFNNLVIALCLSNGWQSLPKARRFYCAFPDQAFRLFCKP